MNTDYTEISKAWDNNKPNGRSGGKTFWQAVKTAIEKQIPKEVDDEWNCPSCNKDVYLVGDEIPKYCWHCGQHLK